MPPCLRATRDAAMISVMYVSTQICAPSARPTTSPITTNYSIYNGFTYRERIKLNLTIYLDKIYCRLVFRKRRSQWTLHCFIEPKCHLRCRWNIKHVLHAYSSTFRNTCPGLLSSLWCLCIAYFLSGTFMDGIFGTPSVASFLSPVFLVLCFVWAKSSWPSSPPYL